MIILTSKKVQEEIINKLSKQPEEVEIVKEEEEDQDRACWLYNNWYEIIWYSIGKHNIFIELKNLKVIKNKGKNRKKILSKVLVLYIH